MFIERPLQLVGEQSQLLSASGRLSRVTWQIEIVDITPSVFLVSLQILNSSTANKCNGARFLIVAAKDTGVVTSVVADGQGFSCYRDCADTHQKQGSLRLRRLLIVKSHTPCPVALLPESVSVMWFSTAFALQGRFHRPSIGVPMAMVFRVRKPSVFSHCLDCPSQVPKLVAVFCFRVRYSHTFREIQFKHK